MGDPEGVPWLEGNEGPLFGGGGKAPGRGGTGIAVVVETAEERPAAGEGGTAPMTGGLGVAGAPGVPGGPPGGGRNPAIGGFGRSGLGGATGTPDGGMGARGAAMVTAGRGIEAVVKGSPSGPGDIENSPSTIEGGADEPESEVGWEASSGNSAMVKNLSVKGF